MTHCPHTREERSALASRLSELAEQVDEDSNRFVALVQDVGAEAVVAVLDEFGSEKIHVPTPDSLVNNLARLRRDEEMRAKYRESEGGVDVEQLALDYSNVYGLGPISKTRVLQIVNNAPRKYADKPANYTSVKLHRDGAYQLLKNEAFARGGVPLHQVLAVIVEVGLQNQDVREKLDQVFGVQMVLDMAVGE